MSAAEKLVERMLCMLPIYEFIDDGERKALLELVEAYGETEHTRGFDEGHNVAAYGEF